MTMPFTTKSELSVAFGAMTFGRAGKQAQGKSQRRAAFSSSRVDAPYCFEYHGRPNLYQSYSNRM